MNLEQRLQQPMVIAEKLCNSERIDRAAEPKRHRAFRHQRAIAHLDVCSERHADDGSSAKENGHG